MTRHGDKITLINYGGGISKARGTVSTYSKTFTAESGARTRSPAWYDLKREDEGVTWIRGWHGPRTKKATALLAAWGLAGYVP